MLLFTKKSHSEQATRARESINKLRSGKKLWIATVVTLPRNNMELLINFLSKNLNYLETMPVKKQCHSEQATRARESINKLRSGKKLWIATVVTLPRNDMELLINFLPKNLHYLETMPVKKQCHSERACERGNLLTNFVLEKLWIATVVTLTRNDMEL